VLAELSVVAEAVMKALKLDLPLASVPQLIQA
jgi:hypothetical protein